MTDRWGVPLIINDNIQVCQAVGAAGVHVGQSDMEAGQVRRLLGPEKIIGVTAKTVEQALAAQAAGADYLGCGAVFGSATKLDTKKMELDTLDDICRHVSIPVCGYRRYQLRKYQPTFRPSHGRRGCSIGFVFCREPEKGRAGFERKD